MDDYNIYGWSPMHEAAYKGYAVAVQRFINYANETQKFHLIDLKTIDELKATPLLIGALGGHLDVIKVLIDSNADINESIQYKTKHKHGLVEIAVIRQDINILQYLYEKLNEELKLCTRIRDLMINIGNDDEIRASIGRTLEVLTSQTLTGSLAKMRDELIKNSEFGRFFSIYLKQSIKNDEAFASCILIILNIMHNQEIRNLFILNNGMNHLIECLDAQKQIIQKETDIHAKISEDIDDNIHAELIKTTLEKFDSCNLMLASLGKALTELSQYNDCIDYIVKENYGEKLIIFIRMLFDSNDLRKQLVNELLKLRCEDSNRLFTANILLEQYIHTYISLLGNLVYRNDRHKKIFYDTFLYEYIMNLWSFIQPTPYNSNKDSRLNDNNSPDGSTITSYYYEFLGNNKTNKQTSNKPAPQRITSSFQLKPKSSQLTYSYDRTQTNKPQPFDFVPTHLSEILDKNNQSIITPILVKLLKLAIIDCVGKAYYNNIDLKKAYLYCDIARDVIYLNKLKNWFNVTNMFINTIAELLEPARIVIKDIRSAVLKTLTMIFEGDKLAVNQIVDYQNAEKSSLIISLRTLLLKSCVLPLREDAIKLVQTMSGGEDAFNSQTQKISIFKAIGTQKFVDALCDSDVLSFAALDAIQIIANGPSFRDNGKLMLGTDELARSNAVPTFVRLLKTKNEDILYRLLQTIPSCCYSIGYDNHLRNQMILIKSGTIQILVDLCKKSKFKNKSIKYEAYVCLSSLVIDNMSARKLVYKSLGDPVLNLIETLLIMLLNVDNYDSSIEEQLDDVENRITAGLALCGFCYQNDDFKNMLVENYGKIQWKIYVDILNFLISLEKSIKSKNKNPYENVVFLRILKLKCLTAFQIVALYSVIFNSIGIRDIYNADSSENANEDDDPRATGIKMLIQLIKNCNNSLIRTLAIDCICRLNHTDKTLAEPIIAIDAIEVLCNRIELSNDKSNNINETEISNCSITLASLTNSSPEARRRILKAARKIPNIMDLMKYHNKTLHEDLLTQWKHYEDLVNVTKKPLSLISIKKPVSTTTKLPKQSKSILKLPDIKT